MFFKKTGKNKRMLFPEHMLKKDSFEKLRHVIFIPTYNCQLDCRNCFTRKKKSEQRGEMEIGSFKGLVNKLMLINGLESVTFSGGEPTLWSHLEEAIVYLRRRYIKTILTTNALKIPEKALPDVVKVNLRVYFDFPQYRSVIDANVDKLMKDVDGKVRVAFSYAFREDDTSERISEVIDYARSKDVKCFFLPQFEFDSWGKDWSDFHYGSQSKKGGLREKCLEIANCLEEKTVGGLNLGNATPLCLFENKDVRTMEKPKGNCESCVFGKLVFNPDGDTVNPCSVLPLKSSLKTHYDLNLMIRDDFGKVITGLQEDVPPKCRDCPDFKKKRCFHGCPAARYFARNT